MIEGRPHEKQFSWIPYSARCERLLFPYEPIKGDHQVTKRVFENAILNSEGTVLHPRISGQIREAFDRDKWTSTLAGKLEQFRKIIGE